MRVIAFAAAIVALTATAAYAGVNEWTRRGLNGRTIQSLVVSPAHLSEAYAAVYGGSTDPDLLKTTDGGQTWFSASKGLERHFVKTLAMDEASQTLYAVALPLDSLDEGSGPPQLYKSCDRGQTWASLGQRGDSILVDQANPVRLYAGIEAGVASSRDGGTTWTSQKVPVPSCPLCTGGETIISLGLDPRNPATIYAGSDADMDHRGAPEAGIFKSTDGGTSWNATDNGLPLLSTFALAVDPSDSSRVVAGTTRGVFVSTDSGGTWSRTFEGATPALVFDPRNPAVLYAGTDGTGVQKSGDRGGHWEPLNLGLADTRVQSLVIDRSGRFLHAGTADGVFRLETQPVLFDVSVAQDGDTRIFSFDVSSGRIVLGAIDQSGKTVSCQPYGPYNGWTPRTSADGNDGVTRILWTHEDGSAALWLAGPLGVQASFRYEQKAGLTAIDVAASLDTHILWTGTDGTAVLETIDATGGIATSLSFGPYAGWSATAIADGSDGLTRVLWNNGDGRAGLSFVSTDGIITTARYGPVTGWTALDVAVSGDGLTRILRAHEDGRITLWILNAAGEVTNQGDVYPGPVGFVPRRIAVAPDGSSRVLFTSSEGNGILWRMSADGIFEGSISLTPDPEPPAPGIFSGTGSQTWTSIATSRALCPQITAQVGTTYPLWISLEVNGSSTTLSLGEEPPSNDPMADGPGIFRGTISGDSISASYAGPFGGFACPEDSSITRRTGGNLTATLSGKTIGGRYTEIYGNDADAVTFVFRFEANLK